MSSRQGFPGIGLATPPNCFGPSLDNITVNTINVSGTLTTNNMTVTGTISAGTIVETIIIQANFFEEYTAGAGLTINSPMYFGRSGVQTRHTVYDTSGSTATGFVNVTGYSPSYASALRYTNTANGAFIFEGSIPYATIYNDGGVGKMLIDKIAPNATSNVDVSNLVIGFSSTTTPGGLRYNNNNIEVCNNLGVWGPVGDPGTIYTGGANIDVTGGVISLVASPSVTNITTSGTVSVGTNLTVTGTSTMTGQITANGGISTTALSSSGAITSLGIINANAGISTTTMTASGLITANGGISSTTLSTSGNATIGGTLGVTSTTTLTGALTANGGISATNVGTTGNITVGGTLTSTGLITANGGISTTSMSTTGNFTVGGTLGVTSTTTLTGALTANGGISTTTVGASGNITTSASLNSNRLAVTDSTNTANIVMSRLANSGTGDSNFNIAAGRGVVTNGPGDVVVRMGMYYGTSASALIDFHRGGVGTDGYMSFFTNGSRKMIIGNSGTVAFIPVGADTAMTIFDSTMGNATTKNIYYGVSQTNNNAACIRYGHNSSGSLANYLALGLVGKEETLCITGDGYVGIGKNNPSYPLDVVGNISLTGNIYNLQSISPSSGTVSSYNVEFKNNSGTSTGGLIISPWVDNRCIMTFVGTSNHNIRSRINSVDNTTFMTINNNGVTHNYFVLGDTNLTVANGAMRMRPGIPGISIPEIRIDSINRPLRPMTGIISISYSSGFGTVNQDQFVGNAYASLVSNRINIQVPDYDCFLLVPMVQIMNVLTSVTDIALVATSVDSSNIRISLFTGGAVTGFDTIGNFIMAIGYMII